MDAMHFEVINPFVPNPHLPMINPGFGWIPPAKQGWIPSGRNALGGVIGGGESLLGGTAGFFLGKAISDDPLVVQGFTTGTTALAGFGGAYLHSKFEHPNSERLRGQFYGAGVVSLLSLFALGIEGLSSLGVIDTLGRTRFVSVGTLGEDEAATTETATPSTEITPAVEKTMWEQILEYIETGANKTKEFVLAPFNGVGLLGGSRFNFNLGNIVDETKKDFAVSANERTKKIVDANGFEKMDSNAQIVQTILDAPSTKDYLPENMAPGFSGIGLRANLLSPGLTEDFKMAGFGKRGDSVFNEEEQLSTRNPANYAPDMGVKGFGKHGHASRNEPAFDQKELLADWKDSVQGFGKTDAQNLIDAKLGFKGVGKGTDYVSDMPYDGLGEGVWESAKQNVKNFVQASSKAVSDVATATLTGLQGNKATDERWYGTGKTALQALANIDENQINSIEELEMLDAMYDEQLQQFGIK